MSGFRVGDAVVYDGPSVVGARRSELDVGSIHVVEAVTIICGIPVISVAAHEAWITASSFRKIIRRDLSAWLETATDFEEPKRQPVNA